MSRPPRTRAYAVPTHPAPTDLRLASNEGRPPRVPDVETWLEAGLLAHYPDVGGLRARLAGRLGIDPERVLATNGADEALLRICLASLGPGRDALVPTPTFEMIPRYVELARGTLRELDWPGGAFPTDALVDAIDERTALVAVVSPNNPTGAVATADDLRRLAAAAPEALILLDHAYVELAGEDLSTVALGLENVVTVRTLSKAWGLAGLRVGYAVGSRSWIDALSAAGSPYAVSGVSAAIACARLDEGQEDVARYAARVCEERALLADRLSELGARPEPSQANFVFARLDDPRWLRDALAGLGIAVRLFPDQPGLQDAVRITCPADPAAFERLLTGIEAALAPEALLFDMDGVLADVTGSYRRAIAETAADFGVELEPGAIEAAKARGDANDDWELTRRLLAQRGVERDLAEVTRRFEELYQGTTHRPGLCQSEVLIPPREGLESLARRLPLGIITGRPRADMERFLERAGIRALFGAVVCREDGPAKPDPTPVRTALERLGARRAWMVGDTPDDLRAARGAGVVPLAVGVPGDVALLRAGAARVLSLATDCEELLS